MIGSDQQSAPKQLIKEVLSHVVLVNDKVGADLSQICIGQSQNHTKLLWPMFFLSSDHETILDVG